MRVFSIIAALSLAACATNDEPAKSPAVDQANQLRDKMCACRDIACTQKVFDEFHRTPHAAAPDDIAAQIRDANREMFQCKHEREGVR